MYVGMSKSSELRSRLTAHLISKNRRTGSVLQKVKKRVDGGWEVSISAIRVEPEELRTYIESKLIGRNRESLEWNTHS
jgi:hypothetical protein